MRQRNLTALDHRHSLAVLPFEPLGSLAHREKDDEHAAKHRDDEQQAKQISVHKLPSGSARRPGAVESNPGNWGD